MKIKSGELIDRSLGVVLIFCCAYAVCAYYLPRSSAVAFAVIICTIILAAARALNLRRGAGRAFSREAGEFFEQLMFKPPDFILTQTHNALMQKGYTSVKRGKRIICGGTSVYYYTELNAHALASSVAQSKGRTLILCRTSLPDAQALLKKLGSVTVLSNEKCYSFFKSLGVLIETKYPFKPKSGVKAALLAALERKKAGRYICFAAVLAAFAVITDTSVVCLVFCSILTVLSILCLFDVKKRFSKVKSES